MSEPVNIIQTPANEDEGTLSPMSGPVGLLVKIMSRRATWVLVDQGIVSAGNFLTSVCLTRGLQQSEFGAYQVLLDTMLYLNSLQNAVVIYPLLVRGATSTDKVNLGRLATASLVFTLALLPILGGAIVIATAVLGYTPIALSVVLAVVLWQLQETLRRGLTADLRFSAAVVGDGISYLGQAALVVVLMRHDWLNLNRAFLAIASTSALAIVVQGFQIGLKPVRISQIGAIAIDFWKLGRWMLLANAGSLISAVGYTWTLTASGGKQATAIFGAVVQAFKLANPVMSSIAGLITPAVARAVSTEGMRAASRSAIRYTALGAAMLLPYFVFLIFAAGPILEYLSKNREKPYYLYGNALRLFVANYVAVYLLSSIGAWLAGLGHSRFNFYVQVANIIASVLVGLPLTYAFGVMGLVIGGLISTGIAAVVAIVFIKRLAHQPSTDPAHARPSTNT